VGCPVAASGNIFSTFTDSQTYGEEIRMEYKFDAEAVKQRIIGKRVTRVDHRGDLILDDGTNLRLYMSDSDCCARAYGDWVVEPSQLDAIITDLKYDAEFDIKDDDYYGGSESTAQITILHNQNPVALADCRADAGNGGYYYSVLSLNIQTPGLDDLDTEVVWQ
jgi:hypothetical protein